MPSGCFDEHRLSFQDEGPFLKESSSICTESSAGSNITVSSREE